MRSRMYSYDAYVFILVSLRNPNGSHEFLISSVR